MVYFHGGQLALNALADAADLGLDVFAVHGGRLDRGLLRARHSSHQRGRDYQSFCSTNWEQVAVQ